MSGYFRDRFRRRPVAKKRAPDDQAPPGGWRRGPELLDDDEIDEPAPARRRTQTDRDGYDAPRVVKRDVVATQITGAGQKKQGLLAAILRSMTGKEIDVPVWVRIVLGLLVLAILYAVFPSVRGLVACAFDFQSRACRRLI